MSEYLYRPMVRLTDKETGKVGEWNVIYSNRGSGRDYRTAGGAKSIITRAKKNNDSDFWRRRFDFEYKIQRRPVETEWEDIPND